MPGISGLDGRVYIDGEDFGATFSEIGGINTTQELKEVTGFKDTSQRRVQTLKDVELAATMFWEGDDTIADQAALNVLANSNSILLFLQNANLLYAQRSLKSSVEWSRSADGSPITGSFTFSGSVTFPQYFNKLLALASLGGDRFFRDWTSSNVASSFTWVDGSPAVTVMIYSNTDLVSGNVFTVNGTGLTTAPVLTAVAGSLNGNLYTVRFTPEPGADRTITVTVNQTFTGCLGIS